MDCSAVREKDNCESVCKVLDEGGVNKEGVLFVLID